MCQILQIVRLPPGKKTWIITDQGSATVPTLEYLDHWVGIGDLSARCLIDFPLTLAPYLHAYLRVLQVDSSVMVAGTRLPYPCTLPCYCLVVYWYPLSGLMADVRAAEDESIFLLHACAHNPTGVDPTREQWAELSKLMKTKKQIAFFDCAYQVSMPPQYGKR